MALTLFDFLILGITGFLIIVGLVRGFISELFSLINWFSSGSLTILLRPFVNEAVSQKISNSIISNLISSIVIFVIVMLVFSIIISQIVKAINAKFPTSVNVTLGVAFGFIKGFLISSLIFVSVLNITGDQADLSSKVGPKWLQESQTYKPLSFGAYLIMPFTDSIMGKIKDKYSIKNKNEDKTIEDNEKDVISKEKQDNTKAEVKDKKGYSKDQINKLDHLIDIIN